MTKLFFLQYKLTLLCLGLIPILYLVFRAPGNKMRNTSRKLKQNMSGTSTNLHETLTAMYVVKVYGKGEYETEKFFRTSDHFRRTAV